MQISYEMASNAHVRLLTVSLNITKDLLSLELANQVT